MARLSQKQEAFCREYVIDYNATQSAIRAGYSEKTARTIACNTLALVNIQSRIAELQTEKTMRSLVTVDNVLDDIKAIIEDCTEKIEKNGVLQMKSAMGALRGCELLGKHLGIFTDKHIVESKIEVTGINVIGVSAKNQV